MDVTRIDEARSYDAPGHFGMSTLRLQGGDASAAKSFVVGLSHALPAGGTERTASPFERTYVVLEGTLVVAAGDEEALLGPLDSCFLPPGEERVIENRTNKPTTFLVVMSSREEN